MMNWKSNQTGSTWKEWLWRRKMGKAEVEVEKGWFVELVVVDYMELVIVYFFAPEQRMGLLLPDARKPLLLGTLSRWARQLHLDGLTKELIIARTGFKSWR